MLLIIKGVFGIRVHVLLRPSSGPSEHSLVCCHLFDYLFVSFLSCGECFHVLYLTIDLCSWCIQNAFDSMTSPLYWLFFY